jgi:general secretion pathway protein D
MTSWIRSILLGMIVTLAWCPGQQPMAPVNPANVPPGFVPHYVPGNPAAVPPQPKPAPSPAKPAAAPATQAAKPESAPPAASSGAQLSPGMPVLNIQNASLTEVIDILARSLKINYILDPRVKGGVTLQTYGEIKPVNPRAMLETILRINGAAMVQVGDVFRIVPMGPPVAQLPLSPQVDAKIFPDDERIMLNLVFLKYSTVGELSKLLQPFLGEGAQMTVYEPANLLLLLDNSRNMRRTMELIALFDSDTLAGQRVRLFEVKNSRPSDIAKELDSVLKSISMGDKASAVRFLAVDRINTVVAIAPNPGVFKQVEEWLKKLDIPQKATAGTMDNYVYRVNYGMAQMLAGAIMQLYMGGPGGYGMGGYGMGGMGGMGGYGMGGMGGYGMGGMGGFGGGGTFGGGMYGGGGYGGGYGGGGYGGGGYGGGGYGGMGMGGYAGMGGGYGGGGYGASPMSSTAQVLGAGSAAVPGAAGTGVGGAVSATQDLTGAYLGSAGYGAMWAKIPRVIPNPFDNTLLIQATPQDYAQILKLLGLLDVPPRQILVEAKIYEVNMTGSFSSGVQAALDMKTGSGGFTSGLVKAATAAGGVSMTAGMLVGNSRQLLIMLTAAQNHQKAKLVSAPSLIATDSIPASINVGIEVPTLTAQAVNGGITSGGNSVFTQAVSNRSSGVTLNVLARVNSSGIVTMVINQDVSAPVASPAGDTIQSPSFSHRAVNTQITLQDGDTIAIGGIINESDTWSSAGVPWLHRIPILGAAFGNKLTSKERTEMVIFITPHVIYDTNQLVEASDQLKSGFKRLMKVFRE